MTKHQLRVTALLIIVGALVIYLIIFSLQNISSNDFLSAAGKSGITKIIALSLILLFAILAVFSRKISDIYTPIFSKKFLGTTKPEAVEKNLQDDTPISLSKEVRSLSKIQKTGVLFLVAFFAIAVIVVFIILKF